MLAVTALDMRQDSRRCRVQALGSLLRARHGTLAMSLPGSNGLYGLQRGSDTRRQRFLLGKVLCSAQLAGFVSFPPFLYSTLSWSHAVFWDYIFVQSTHTKEDRSAGWSFLRCGSENCAGTASIIRGPK